MRCYFMRNGHIAGVEFLIAGPDESLIDQGMTLFQGRSDKVYDGFEVWDGARRVYVHPEEIKDHNSS